MLIESKGQSTKLPGSQKVILYPSIRVLLNDPGLSAYYKDHFCVYFLNTEKKIRFVMMKSPFLVFTFQRKLFFELKVENSTFFLDFFTFKASFDGEEIERIRYKTIVKSETFRFKAASNKSFKLYVNLERFGYKKCEIKLENLSRLFVIMEKNNKNITCNLKILEISSEKNKLFVDFSSNKTSNSLDSENQPNQIDPEGFSDADDENCFNLSVQT